MTEQQVAIFILSTVMLLIAGSFSLLFINRIKQFFIKLFFWLKRFWYKVILFFNITKIILKNVKGQEYGSLLVNTIFDVFCYYYENILSSEANTLALDPYKFENGFIDIYNIYRWIVDIRENNYKDIYSIEYDNDKNAFLYYSQYFEGFKFKIDKIGVLHVKPYQYVEAEDPYTSFSINRLQIIEKLYNIDNEKCMWIIERRKYFNL